jgi:peptidoglycan/LPS O-acetylase OafA/YrhL
LDIATGLAKAIQAGMRSPLPHQLPYRADIDGLRAIAVLLVVIFHAHPEQLPGGFIGVDVFFVISGFLISSLLFESAETGSFSLREFYARRIRRIFPALIIVLAATFLAGSIFLLPQSFSNLSKLVLSSTAFVPNFRLWSEAGYFAGDPNTRPLLHLWSLGVEEQFYLVWPLSVLIFWKRGMAWVIALLAILSFLTGAALITHHTNAVFYLPITRLWELLAGGFLAWRERRHIRSNLGGINRMPQWILEAFPIAGMCLLLAGGLSSN